MKKTLQNILIGATAVVVVALVAPAIFGSGSSPSTSTEPARSAQTKACTRENFALVMKNGSRERFAAHYFADITNNNAVPCGVELEVKITDKAGNLLEVSNPWPASVRNLAPGETITYDAMMTGETAERADGVSMRVVDAKAW